MQIEKNIAATLQRRMDEAGKTKLEFSRDLGIPRSTLQGYLRGEKGLRSDSIEELAKRLGMSPAQLISGPGAAEAVSPAANAASSLAQHSLVRALAEEIVEAALRRSGEWAGLDAAETGNAPDGAYRYALYEAHGAARVPYAYGILGQQRLDGEWKTVAMIAPFSNGNRPFTYEMVLRSNAPAPRRPPLSRSGATSGSGRVRHFRRRFSRLPSARSLRWDMPWPPGAPCRQPRRPSHRGDIDGHIPDR